MSENYRETKVAKISTYPSEVMDVETLATTIKTCIDMSSKDALLLHEAELAQTDYCCQQIGCYFQILILPFN